MIEFNLIDILISLATGLITLGIGLSLTLNDFKHVFVQPKAILLALFSQMIALPLIAFFISWFAPLSPEFKMGLIILAATPGGATSGFIIYLLKADIALSVSLTAINSFLTLISIPIVVTLGLQTFMLTSVSIELPIFHTLMQILVAIIFPTLIGITIRHFIGKLAIKYEHRVKILMVIFLLIVFLIKIFASKNNGGVDFQLNDFKEILPFALLFNFCCLLSGYLFLKIQSQSHKVSLTASIENSVHNAPLAILVASTILQNSEMTKPILIYALFSFWTALIFGFLANKYKMKTGFSD